MHKCLGCNSCSLESLSLQQINELRDGAYEINSMIFTANQNSNTKWLYMMMTLTWKEDLMYSHNSQQQKETRQNTARSNTADKDTVISYLRYR